MSLTSAVSRRLRIANAAMALLAVLMVALAFTRQTCADPSPPLTFTGTFSNDKLTMVLSESGTVYVGTITLGDSKFPVKATSSAQTLSGSFVASGNEFPFTATFADGKLILITGGATYSLIKAVSNPLAQTGVATAAPMENTSVTGDFSVLGATQTGKTLFIKLPAAQSLASAMTQTADALGKVFDAKPSLGTAFADAQTKSKGGVSLTATLKGKEVHGEIFCGIGPNGGSATVVFATAGAPKEDVATLMGYMPAPIKMQTHTFPDGSGSIDMPNGWTTNYTSAHHGIVVRGPAGQAVVFSNIVSMYDPNCRTVRMSQQTYKLQMQNYDNQMRQYQRQLALHQQFPNTVLSREPVQPVAPDPDPNIQFPHQNFCKYCDGPEEVLKNWYPIAEARQKRAGGPYTTLDKIIEIFPGEPNPLIPGSKSGVAYIAVTDHDGNQVTHVRALNMIATAPVVQGEVWQISSSNMRAPDATFDRDLPVMNAIMNSVKLDMNVVNQENQAEGDAIRKMGDEMYRQIQQSGRNFQDQQAVNFNNHEMQIAAQEKAVHDSSSDYIEYIRGVRDVYDTRTGQTTTVDLFNSNAIVNGLNEGANDPNRFLQIPLRYER